MSPKVLVIRLRESVAKIYQLLMSTNHHAFPVVSEFTPEDEDGYFDIDVGQSHFTLRRKHFGPGIFRFYRNSKVSQGFTAQLYPCKGICMYKDGG